MILILWDMGLPCTGLHLISLRIELTVPLSFIPIREYLLLLSLESFVSITVGSCAATFHHANR